MAPHTLLSSIFAALSIAPTVLASAACISSGLLIPPSSPVLEQLFTLTARNGSGHTLPVVSTENPLPGGFFQPLSLGPSSTNVSDDIVPKFQLQGGRAYANGGTVLSMKATPLLVSVPLYISADSSQVITDLAAVNATCDGVETVLLRFQDLLDAPLAGGIANGSFAPGTALNSPILEPVLGLDLGVPIDLIIVPYDDGSDQE